ncbi:MAG TPA: WYL domain-containing protein, partial [Polyangiaceae bacterium]|nr:WYL domain-containing protein [Polyangiaceae bacterium]
MRTDFGAHVGRKGGTETVANVLLAFLESRTWRQAELAKRAGVERKQIVRVLEDLQLAGFALEREEDHPNVYWSVPKGWFPGAMAFARDDVTELTRLLQLAPQSVKRDQLLRRIASMATGMSIAVTDSVLTRPLSPEQESSLALLQDAAQRAMSTNARYYTLSRGEIAWRVFSVHRIFVDQGRFVATCHRDGRLKWFRLDGVLSVELAEKEPFRAAPSDELQRLLDESVDGYHSGAPPTRCVFRVRANDARWVKGQLAMPFH